MTIRVMSGAQHSCPISKIIGKKTDPSFEKPKYFLVLRD